MDSMAPIIAMALFLSLSAWVDDMGNVVVLPPKVMDPPILVSSFAWILASSVLQAPITMAVTFAVAAVIFAPMA